MQLLRCYNPTPTQLEEIASFNQPVKIIGLVGKWRGLMQMTPEFFADKYSDYQVDVDISNGAPEQHNAVVRRMKVRDYIKLLRDKESNPKDKRCFYVNEAQNFLNVMGLKPLADQYFGPYCPSTTLKLKKANLLWYAVWIGCVGSRTGLHFDTDHRNYLCQIYGKKRLYLAPPQQSSLMYPGTKFDREMGSSTSQVDLWNPDYKRFPNFKKANFITVDLRPGEMLYVPSYWWHAAENLSTNVAISCRFENIRSMIKMIPTEMLNTLHDLGLYKKGNCTCHPSDEGL